MTDAEQILLNRVKLIGDGEWSLIGTPQELIDEINRLIKLAKKEERNRLTHQQIDSKIISSDDFKIEFELKFTDEPEHKYVFASSPKGFQVAVDGKNIVSKLSNNLSKGESKVEE